MTEAMTILSFVSYLVTLTGQVSAPLTQASGEEAEPRAIRLPPTPALLRTSGQPHRPLEKAARSRKGARCRCQDALESSQFSGKTLIPNPRPNWGREAPQKPYLPQCQRPSVSCSRQPEQS